jgi:GNAT superfamily N-acetyltransferase
MGEMSQEIAIRSGTSADVPAVLGLLDGAVAWLVAQGRTGQWGTEPASADPRRQEQARAWVESGGLYLAEVAGRPVGALVVGTAPAYVPPASEPELYVNLLVTDRRHVGGRIGARLLAHARHLARRAGVSLLRVDCYRGPDRALVRYYEGQGFVATREFTVDLPGGPWPGQVLEQRLA